MKLIQIDKARYRKHLNQVIIACVIALAVGSLAISQTLIALFPDPSGSHFHWNLLGVVVCSLLVGFVLNKYRNHDYMTEIVYVWELKKALNKITRKMPKLKAAGREGNADAIGSAEVEHQYEQTADQRGDGECRGKTGVGFVRRLAEDARERGRVE